MRQINKKIELLVLLMAVCLSGCGQQTVDIMSESITLLDPVSMVGTYEAAAYRTISEVKTYSAYVYPTVAEYEFEDGKIFTGYGAFPGESVKKGASLLYTDTESLDKQITELTDKMASAKKEYEEYCQDTKEDLVEPKGEWKRLGQILDNLNKEKPSSETDPSYTQWKSDYQKYDGLYRSCSLTIDKLEAALEQKTGLFEIDYAYMEGQLSYLNQQKRDSSILAGKAGTVVAISYHNQGDYLAGDAAVIAMGDTNELVLKCDYIEKTVMAKASRYYAMVHGQTYEIEYESMDTALYNQLSKEDSKVYSTFHFTGDTPDIEAGDFAVITLVIKEAEEVLSVPKSAIQKDTEGYFVYISEENSTIRRNIKTGITDGVYTEIGEGLEAGDMVQVEEAIQFGNSTTVVSYGAFSSSFSGSGYLYYPDSIIITNPVEYGTTYYLSTEVSLYEHVEKGDTIATVYVEADAYLIQQKEVKLKRTIERMNDLIKAGEEDNKRGIEDKKEEIVKLEKELAQLRSDGETTRITATRSGIIIWQADFEEQTIVPYQKELVQIADESNCYIAIDNENQLLNYGNQVNISYKNKQNETEEAAGMVALVSNAGVLDQNLKSDYTLIKIPETAIGSMAATSEVSDGWWNRNRFTVSAQLRNMEGVLVVPKNAVKEINGKTYVCTILEDGSRQNISFIAGGYDDKNYWVLEGLWEGMEVCCE